MTRSMTAFSSAEAKVEAGTLGCELRAVNHRFLELGLRLPEELRVLEPRLRERVAERVSRGKLDLVMRLRPRDGDEGLQLNDELLQRLADAANALQARVPSLRLDFATLLQFPGVLQVADVDSEQLHADALALLDRTLDGFIANREREGAKLGSAIRERVAAIDAIAERMRALVPAIREAQRSKLLARLSDLEVPAEPARVEQELVLALQRLDVDEELDRLQAHVAEIGRVLDAKGPVGRRLDFLLQEFNREANTLGSKSVDLRTGNASVELKVLIDQIREQAQNIE
ncbi:MAG: YicC/YloC family endoribonuclease [Pseudoxanthomonas suwonensis]|nr:YicC/YloC family endoribonuclease [Pseudoxanthomonas suwonensis]